MRKLLLFAIPLCTVGAFGQKTKPILRANLVSTTVNEGNKNHFTDNVSKRDLVFTIDAEAKLNGEITITNDANSTLLFKGMMKDNYLVDSAVWYDNNNIVKVVHFKDKCCSNANNHVDPTPKVLSAIKGEQEGVERVYHSKKAGVLKSVSNYKSGKKHGKSYEYDSTGTLCAVRTYKDDMLHDTTWINPKRKNPDMEIYANGVPTGVWKKYNSNGGLLEVSYKSDFGDSTVLYGSDAKLLSIKTLGIADQSYTRIGREYDSKLKLSKLYYIKDRVDTNASVLHGMYEEYTNGKISLRGEYWLGTKIETWITFNAKGSETNWENFTTRDIAMSTIIEGAPKTSTAVAVDIFPPALSKSSITMELASNGKVEKIFKKTAEINWELSVKSSTDWTVTCTDPNLSTQEQTDVVDYLKSSITTVKGVRYSHKEVNFTSHYKLTFN
jgi:antitoxin component YwqK of YwqJK toxin-antitoxin module